MLRSLTICAALLATAAAARAEVSAVVSDHVAPGFAAFAKAAGDLSDAARGDCRAEGLKPSYDAAFDAWLGVAHLRTGPTEAQIGSIAFWPDKRGFTPRTLSALITNADPAVDDPADFAEVSVAAHGFLALERMLFDPEFSGYGDDEYACRLVQAIAADLAARAEVLERDWQEYATLLVTAGRADNATFLSEEEAKRAVYTQVLSGLEFIEDQRIARPLGTFDRPRPTRAEAWRAGRPLRNVRLSLAAILDLTRALSNTDIPQTEEAFDAAFEAADAVTDPAFQDISDAAAWLKLDILRQRVHAVRDTIAAEIGSRNGWAAGFNSADGD